MWKLCVKINEKSVSGNYTFTAESIKRCACSINCFEGVMRFISFEMLVQSKANVICVRGPRRRIFDSKTKMLKIFSKVLNLVLVVLNLFWLLRSIKNHIPSACGYFQSIPKWETQSEGPRGLSPSQKLMALVWPFQNFFSDYVTV